MSVNAISSNGSTNVQTAGNLLMQEILQEESGTQSGSGILGLLQDQMTLSSASQQLSQAPTAVTQALSDLLSGQTNVQADLAQVKSYFQQNPQSLSSVLNAVNGDTGTYSSSGALGSVSGLVAALQGASSAGTSDGSLLLSLMNAQTSDPLFGPSDSSSSTQNFLF